MFVSMIPLKKVILEKRIFDYLFSQKTVGYRSYTSPYRKKNHIFDLHVPKLTVLTLVFQYTKLNQIHTFGWFSRQRQTLHHRIKIAEHFESF